MRQVKSKKYPLLREEFSTYEEVAQVLGKSRTYVCNRMNGELSFTYQDKVKIAEHIGRHVEEVVA